MSEKERGVKTVEIELPADQHDINCQYDEALFALDEKQTKEEVRSTQMYKKAMHVIIFLLALQLDRWIAHKR